MKLKVVTKSFYFVNFWQPSVEGVTTGEPIPLFACAWKGNLLGTHRSPTLLSGVSFARSSIT